MATYLSLYFQVSDRGELHYPRLNLHRI